MIWSEKGITFHFFKLVIKKPFVCRTIIEKGITFHFFKLVIKKPFVCRTIILK